jgi:hypothetical protein
MVDSTNVTVDLPEHEHLNETNEKSSTELTTVETEPLPKIVRISSIVGLIIFALASAIPSKYKIFFD